ncbi:MAG: alkaline phosphatase PhoX [Gemmatimonadaceae bacterium]
MSDIDRRRFLQRSALVTGGVLLAPSLRGLTFWSRGAAGDQRAAVRRAGLGDGGYGPLVSAGPDLDLPAGFTYVALGVAGSRMSDGLPTPLAHDGMSAFTLPNGNVRLIRNHEVRFASPDWMSRNVSKAYDRKAGGGTVSLEVRVGKDGTRELVRDFLSLSGTAVNCAGGPTPWRSWLTCEETTQGARAAFEKEHGYIFEVPVSAEAEVTPVPLKAMGRFVHEAVAVDRRTGIVYETEDMRFDAERNTPGAGFYRFIPRMRERLVDGGRLQMLAIRDRPRYRTFTGQRPGATLPVVWVDIDDPDPADAEANPFAVSSQGFAKGAAVFQRLEGCWFGDNRIFFHATSGGDAGKGQVWQYRPRGSSRGELTLLFESPGGEVLDSPDNITVSPHGGLVICEDGAADGQQFVRGLTRDGRIFDIARNRANTSEFAGACFSPDGRTLFVNVQGSLNPTASVPGKTFAIWGPWERGAL